MGVFHLCPEPLSQSTADRELVFSLNNHIRCTTLRTLLASSSQLGNPLNADYLIVKASHDGWTRIGECSQPGWHKHLTYNFKALFVK